MSASGKLRCSMITVPSGSSGPRGASQSSPDKSCLRGRENGRHQLDPQAVADKESRADGAAWVIPMVRPGDRHGLWPALTPALRFFLLVYSAQHPCSGRSIGKRRAMRVGSNGGPCPRCAAGRSTPRFHPIDSPAQGRGSGFALSTLFRRIHAYSSKQMARRSPSADAGKGP